MTEVLDELEKSGLVNVMDIHKIRRMYLATQGSRVYVHPLLWISERKLKKRNSEQILSLEDLTRWLADYAKLPYLHIDPLKVEVDSVIQVISKKYIANYQIVPVAVDEHTVTFATSEPFYLQWMVEMQHVLRKDIKIVVSNPIDVSRYKEDFFDVSHSIRKVKKQQIGQTSTVNNVEALIELGKKGNLSADDQHIVTLVDWLLQYAFDQRASDIHLEPRRGDGNIRFRIDGILHTVYKMPATIMNAVTSRIKILGRMDISDKRRPQDGRIKTKMPNGDEIELRLSTMPTAFGEKLVMRIFDPQVLVRDLNELGFGKKDAEIWEEMSSKTNGLILVTGPTGSGKTTTLYSTLKALATSNVNVCTVEDPIEMVEEKFNQMQVHKAIDVDFASGIKTLLRQDPDIIMVGEIRDKETAEMAIQASLTGHLVLSTLHTNDAASSITRLLDIGVPSYLMNATVLGIVAQRLVRVLCPYCKVKGEVNEDDWADMIRPWRLEPPKTLYKATGCEECRQTGFRGRLGIYEIIRMTKEMRQLIHDGKSLHHLTKLALKQGTELLRISGARKVKAGQTTMEEVLRVAPAYIDVH